MMRHALLSTLVLAWIASGCSCGEDPAPDPTPVPADEDVPRNQRMESSR